MRLPWIGDGEGRVVAALCGGSGSEAHGAPGVQICKTVRSRFGMRVLFSPFSFFRTLRSFQIRFCGVAGDGLRPSTAVADAEPHPSRLAPTACENRREKLRIDARESGFLCFLFPPLSFLRARAAASFSHPHAAGVGLKVPDLGRISTVRLYGCYRW
jgi:hypothetical protein